MPPLSLPRLGVSMALVALLLATAMVYRPGLAGGFLFDDFPNIVENAALRSAALSLNSLSRAAFSSDSGPLSRPIASLSFALQITASGLSPFALKLANLLIHLGNGLLIYLLARRILDVARPTVAAGNAWTLEGILPFAVAAAWLLAPINLTAVLYVVQRMESLSTLFMLLGLLAYLRGRLRLNAGRGGGLAWMACGLAGGAAAGVLAKETAVILPAYAFILEWVLFDFRTPGARRDGISANLSQKQPPPFEKGGLGGATPPPLKKGGWGGFFGVETQFQAHKSPLFHLFQRGRPFFPGLRNHKLAPMRRDGRVVGLFAGVLLIPGMLGVFVTLPAALSGAAFANRPFTLSERLLTEGRVLVDYLGWIIAPPPETLSLYHDDYAVSQNWLSPPGTLAAVLFLCALLGLALWLKSRRPLIALGVLFFFAGHGLVSTYLPLELVYEHRNYLPSFGIFLAVFAMLLSESNRAEMRTLRLGIAAGLIVWSGFLTSLRANEWSDPVRLAYTEAARHPASPRANYELGHTLIRGEPDPGSPQYSMAIKSFEIAAGLPGAGLHPLHALIFMRGKHGQPVDERLWGQAEKTIDSRPLSNQDLGGLHSLLDCLIKEECQLDPERLGQVLARAAAKNPSRPTVLTLQANHAVNVVHDFALGLKVMQRVVALAPENPQFWKNLVTLQIALGQVDEAHAGIERLRELDRFGLQRPETETLKAAAAKKAAELARTTFNRGASP